MSGAVGTVTLRLNDELTKSLGKVKADFGSFGNVALGAITAVGIAGASALGMAVTKTAEFNKEMSGLQAVSGATDEQMKQVGASAMQFGKDTTFSATESAQAMSELVKAGMSIPEVLGGATAATVALAAAGDYPLAQAAEVSSAIKNSFQLAATKMPHLADVVAGAANASAMSVGDFGESIKAVGPTAGSLNISLDDTAASLGVMAKYGLKGSDAGNSFKRMLVSLANPSAEASAEMQRLGINVFDAGGKMKPMSAVAEELYQATGNLSDQAKAAALSTIFGTYGMSAATDLAKGGAAAFDEMATSIGKVSAADVAAKKLDNLAGDIQALTGSVETGLIAFGQGLDPIARMAVQGATQIVNAILPIAERVGAAIPPVIASARAALAPLADMFRTVAGAVATLIGSNPVPFFAAVAGVLVTLLVPAIYAAGAALWTIIGPAILSAIAVMSPFIPAALAIGAALAVVAAVVQANWSSIAGAFASAGAMITPALTTIKGAIDAFMLGFQAAPAAGWVDSIVLGLASMSTAVPGASAVLQNLASIVSVVGTVFSTVLVPILYELGLILVGALNFGLSLVSMAFGFVGQAVTLFMSNLSLLGPALLIIGALIIGNVLPGLAAWAGALLVQGVTSVVAFGASIFTTLIPAVLSAAASFISGGVSGIVTFAMSLGSAALAAVTAGASFLVNLIPSLASTAISAASAGAAFLANLIPSLLSTATRAVAAGAAFLAGLIPALAASTISALASAQAFLAGLIPSLASTAMRAVATGAAFLTGMVPALATAAASAWASATAFIAGLMPALVAAGGAALAAGASIIMALLPLWPIILGIIAVVALLRAAWQNNFGGIRDIVGSVVAFLQDKFGWLIGAIGRVKDALAGLVGSAKSAVSGVKAAFTGQIVDPKRLVPDAYGEAKRAGQMHGQMFKDGFGAGSVPLPAPEMPGAGGGGGGGGGAAAPAAGGGGGGGGGGAAQDPAQAAMQAVSGTVQAIQGVMDFAEKAFKFRGFPPPEIMDELFKGLKDIITRAISLAKGFKPDQVELASAVGQMAGSWIQALTGLVDLAEKLARYRVPTADAKAQLMAMAKWLLNAAMALTKVFQGGKGIEEALAQAAISGKVAETLKTWAEFFKTLAEATEAMAKARWDIDLSPVMAFVTKLAASVVRITMALKAQLGPLLRVVLADAADVAATLRPWVELLKSIAEVTGSLAKARWNVDAAPAEGFIKRLAEFALSMLASLQRDLGPALLLAMDDSKLVAETLKAWLEPLTKMKDVTASIARMRPVDPAQAEGFVMSILDMSMRFTALVRARLGPQLLVGLADSKAVAETLGAWLGPLEKVGAVAQSIDVMRGLTQRRAGDAFAGLGAFILGLTGVLGQFVERARAVLGPMILVAIEDSKEVAASLGAWLDPISKIGAVSDAIDRMRGYAKVRADKSFAAVGDFMLGIANSMGQIVQRAQGVLGPAILVAMETSAEVGKAFGPWLDMLAKAGAAADSVDHVTALAQQRMDVGLGAVFAFLVDMGNRGWATVQAVQRWPNPSEFLSVSQTVAQTFGAWLDMLTKVGGAVDSIRRITRLGGGEMEAVTVFLLDIAVRFQDGVKAVANWPDPNALLGVSQTVAATFGAWLDMLAKVGAAVTSITGLDPIDPGAITTAGDWLMAIAGSFAPLVVELNRRADPKMIQQVSSQIGATFGAWVDLMAKTADMALKLVMIEPIQPGQWDIIAGAVRESMARAQSLSADFRALSDVAREALTGGLADYAKVAGEAIGLFDKAAGLGAKMAAAVLPTPETYGVVEGIIARTLAAVRAMAEGSLPRLRSQMQRLSQQVTDYTKIAGEAVGLFDKAAGLGAKMRDAAAPTPGDFILVTGIIASVVRAVMSLAGDIMPRLASEQRRFTEGLTAFAKIAGDSVGLFEKVAGLGAKMRAAVAPTLGQYILVSSVIAGVVRQVASLAGDIIPKAQTEAQAMVAQFDLFNKIASPAIDLVLKAAGIGEALESAVKVNATRLGFVRDAIMLIVGVVGEMAAGWVAAQTRVSQSVEDIKSFSGAAQAALAVIKPAVEALTALASPDLLPASHGALRMVGRAIVQIVALIEETSAGWRTATGEIDKARTEGIETFAKAASAALGPVKDVVDVLSKLTTEQGKLGGLTGAARAQIRAGIVSLVDLMTELSAGYNAGQVEGRMALDAVAGFSKSVGEIVKPVSDVVKTLGDVWSFAFAPDKNNADKIVPVVRDFSTKTMSGVRLGIEALVTTMEQVFTDLGPAVLKRAEAAGKVMGPVAAAIGSMIEPVQKLLENPFVDAKRRSSSVMANAAQTRIKALASNVEKGVKTMAETLIRALSGISVPDGLENGVNRLLGVVSGIMAAIQQAMNMPPIDFGKVSDLVRAANILGGIQMGLAGAGAGGGSFSIPTPGTPGPGGGGGSGASQQHVFTEPPVFQGPVTLQLANAVLTGDVDAMGVVRFTGTQAVTVQIEGQTIQQTARTGSFETGQSRESRTGRQA